MKPWVGVSIQAFTAAVGVSAYGVCTENPLTTDIDKSMVLKYAHIITIDTVSKPGSRSVVGSTLERKNADDIKPST